MLVLSSHYLWVDPQPRRPPYLPSSCPGPDQSLPVGGPPAQTTPLPSIFLSWSCPVITCGWTPSPDDPLTFHLLVLVLSSHYLWVDPQPRRPPYLPSSCPGPVQSLPVGGPPTQTTPLPSIFLSWSCPVITCGWTPSPDSPLTFHLLVLVLSSHYLWVDPQPRQPPYLPSSCPGPVQSLPVGGPPAQTAPLPSIFLSWSCPVITCGWTPSPDDPLTFHLRVLVLTSHYLWVDPQPRQPPYLPSSCPGPVQSLPVGGPPAQTTSLPSIFLSWS